MFHLVTGSFEPHRKFLDDRAYGEALDSIVKAVCDIMIVRLGDSGKEELLMGKRKVHPLPDWWIVGGRMFPGERWGDSCSRLCKRELNLDLIPSRFIPLGCNTLVFDMREQHPTSNGTCDVQCVLVCKITMEESLSIILDEKEYSDQKWVLLSEIESLPSSTFHPGIINAIDKYNVYKAWENVEKNMSSKVTDSELLSSFLFFREMKIKGETRMEGKSNYSIENKDLNYKCNVFLQKY